MSEYPYEVDIEGIAQRVIKAYKKLPHLCGAGMTCIKPEILIQNLLGLKLDHQRLSIDGSILGLTAFCEIGVGVYDEENRTVPYFLDGRTILVERELKEYPAQRGRYHFTLAHEAAHHILAMLYPDDTCLRRRCARYYRKHPTYRGASTDRDERQADALAAALLMPADLVRDGMQRCGLGDRLDMLNRVFRPTEYNRFCNLAETLGVSKTALSIRMKSLGYLNKDYLADPYALVNVTMDDDEMEGFNNG